MGTSAGRGRWRWRSGGAGSCARRMTAGGTWWRSTRGCLSSSRTSPMPGRRCCTGSTGRRWARTRSWWGGCRRTRAPSRGSTESCSTFPRSVGRSRRTWSGTRSCS
jgi:hypothetical protein